MAKHRNINISPEALQKALLALNVGKALVGEPVLEHNVSVGQTVIPPGSGVLSHELVVDQADAIAAMGTSFKAFCSCGWAGERWIHSDEFDHLARWKGMRDDVNDSQIQVNDSQIQAAQDAATAEGDAHLEDVKT